MAEVRPLAVTPFELAQRFVGTKEVAGLASNPLILAMLQLDADWPKDDDVPWCSAFTNWICWLLRLPRSKSLAARSWLVIGEGIDAGEARVGFDVVVLRRGDSPLSGHVGFYAGWQDQDILLLGGNQGNGVSVAPFDADRIVSVRRLQSA